MLKRFLTVLTLVALFVVMAEPRHGTNSMLLTEAEIAALDAADELKLSGTLRNPKTAAIASFARSRRPSKRSAGFSAAARKKTTTNFTG